MLLLEKTKFPREKVCGDGLTPRAVRALVAMGIDTSPAAPGQRGWLRNRGLRVYGGGRMLELDWPDLATYPDYGLVRTFLLRAPSLPARVRTDLAEQVADPVAGRLRPSPPPGVAAEAFLECVAAVYQQRQSTAGGAATAPR